MAAGSHLGFHVTRNSAIRSSDPENRTLEPNMKCMGSSVARGLSSHRVWGGEPHKTNLLPPGKGPSTPPHGGVPVLTTSWHVHCMLTYCYNAKKRAFILLKKLKK